MKKVIIKIENKEYRACILGEGTPLFLFHGLGGGVSNWDGLIENFEEGYQFIVIHLRPLLLSRDKLSINEQVNLLTQIMNKVLYKLEKENSQFHFVSTSYGSVLCFELEKRFSGKVLSSTVINPLLPNPLSKMKSSLLKIVLNLSVFPKLLHFVIHSYFGGYSIQKIGNIFNVKINKNGKMKLLNLRKILIIQNSIHRFYWLAKKHRWDTEYDFKNRVKVPVLMFFGEKDELFSELQYEKFSKWIFTKGIHKVKGGGHMMAKTHAKELVPEIIEFIQKHSIKEPSFKLSS